VSWRLKSHVLSTDSILPSASPSARQLWRAVNMAAPLQCPEVRRRVAGVPEGLQSRRHAAGCHLVQERIRGRNQRGNRGLSVLNSVPPFETLILGMGNGHVHGGERVDAGGVSEPFVIATAAEARAWSFATPAIDTAPGIQQCVEVCPVRRENSWNAR